MEGVRPSKGERVEEPVAMMRAWKGMDFWSASDADAAVLVVVEEGIEPASWTVFNLEVLVESEVGTDV